MTPDASTTAFAPAVLLPYQQRWVSDRAQVKVYEKSRRTGISWATAAESALLAGESSGQDCWYVGYNKEMALEFVRYVAEWAKQFQLAASEIGEELIEDEDKSILTYVVHFASGFRVTALSSRPSNLRGKQGYVIIDEAAFHEQLDELLKAAMALTMWGGRVAIVSTHDGVDNPFNVLVNDVKSGKFKFSLHRTTIDEALEDGVYRRICLRLGTEWTDEGEVAWLADLLARYGENADEELRCVPKNSGGAYLPRPLIEARMDEAPVVRLELDDAFAHRGDEDRQAFMDAWLTANVLPLLEALPRTLLHAFGEDFGRVSDLTVIVPITLEQNLTRRVPFTVELRNVPFRQQEQALFFIVDRLPRMMGGKLDGTGNGAALAEYAVQRYGSHVEAVHLSDKWYAEHLPPFKAAFEDGTIVVPRDADVLQDLRALQVINGVPKLPKAKKTGSDGKRRHGDSAIALALAYSASSGEPEEFDYRPVPVRGVLGKMLDRAVKATAGFRGRRGVW